MNDLTVMIKPASSKCNLACEYCFYLDTARHRHIADYGFMAEETLETVVKKAADEAKNSITLAFQGGEPLLRGLPFYKRLITLEQQFKRENQIFYNVIQTNGTLLNDEWAQFFAENDFLVGLSLDGYEENHNLYRKKVSGEGTFSDCLKAKRLLDKYNVQYNVLTVLTPTLLKHPDKLYKFYKQNGFRYIQLIPQIISAHGQEDKATALAFGSFLIRFFDRWYEDFVKGDIISVRHFDNYIRLLAGYAPESCAMRGECSCIHTIEADGSVYPCDFYVTDVYKLGNIKTHSFADMANNSIADGFIKESDCRICARCKYFTLCRNGCKRDRLLTNGSYGKNRYCEGFYAFFDYALPKMLSIARKI